MKFKNVLCLVLIGLLLEGCSFSDKEELNCIESTNLSRELMTTYIMGGTRETKIVDSALTIINEALENCEDSDIQAILINQKIEALVYLNNYQECYTFIGLTKESMFSKKYKKEYYFFLYKGLYHLSIADTILGSKALTNAELELENYLSSNPNDVEALQELYYTKSVFRPLFALEQELDSLLNAQGNKKRIKVLSETVEILSSKPTVIEP